MRNFQSAEFNSISESIMSLKQFANVMYMKILTLVLTQQVLQFRFYLF